MSFLNDKRSTNRSIAENQQSTAKLPLPPLRILIIENEYLIAMDAERILTGAFSCEVVITKAKDFAFATPEQDFDIVLVDFSTSLGPAAKDLVATMESGAKLVFTTVIDGLAAGIPGFESIPVVLKPYDDAQLVKAVRSSLNADKMRSGESDDS